MNTTTAPLAKGDTFEVTSFIGDPEHPFVGQRFVAGTISHGFVYGLGAGRAFKLGAEVRRVEPTAEEVARVSYLLPECDLCCKPCNDPSGLHKACTDAEAFWAEQ